MNAEDILPCDVHLPPATIIRKGCLVSTLMNAFRQREGIADELTRFDRDMTRQDLAAASIRPADADQAAVVELRRELDRLTGFVGFVRKWVHRETPPNAVNAITDEMRLDAIKHHPLLNNNRACLAGLARDREIQDLEDARKAAEVDAAKMREENERLREALRPFAEAGRHIPLNHADTRPAAHVNSDARHPGTVTTISVSAFRLAATLRTPATGQDGADPARDEGERS